MQFRDLGAQYNAHKAEIDAAIQATLNAGCYIGGFPVRKLEEELADYVGVRHCVSCANGTDALQLALMAWGIGEGDAVFVPDFTFFSSGEVICAVGATPVFVDVDRTTFNLNPDKLEDAVCAIKQEGSLIPRAVIAVDLYGLPANYPAINRICKSHDLLLLEDGAQGFGGSIDGKVACSFGDISTTSFFPAKPLGCYGDGGAVFTDNDEWAELIRSFAVHGKGSMKYDNVRIGMNSRLDTIQAAILRVKLKAFIDYELGAVNKVAGLYDEMLRATRLPGQGVILPIVPKGYQSSWAQYTIQLPPGSDRSAIQKVFAEQGIPTMVYYPKPMHQQKAFRGCSVRGGESYEVTDFLCASVLSLPIGPYCTAEDVKAVVDLLGGILI